MIEMKKKIYIYIHIYHENYYVESENCVMNMHYSLVTFPESLLTSPREN